MVRLAFTAGARVPAGAAVRVEIDGAERKAVLLVPAAALQRDGIEEALYVVDDAHHAHRRKVVVGVRSVGGAEIVSGAEEGETVIVRGQEGLPDGAEVTPAP